MMRHLRRAWTWLLLALRVNQPTFMPKSLPLPPEVVSEIRTRYAAGEPMGIVAKELDVTIVAALSACVGVRRLNAPGSKGVQS